MAATLSMAGLDHGSLEPMAPTARSARLAYPRGGKTMAPTLANGKICYLEIPTADIPRSVHFYEAVFGWQTRRRGDGATAFDDGAGEVSGAWVTGRASSPAPGLLLYIMVDSLPATVEKVLAHGGRIVQPMGADAPELTARFADPDGNVLGLYQEPNRPVES
jgi:predicted enzyme related to lactoylglutathione lyase